MPPASSDDFVPDATEKHALVSLHEPCPSQDTQQDGEIMQNYLLEKLTPACTPVSHASANENRRPNIKRSKSTALSTLP